MWPVSHGGLSPPVRSGGRVHASRATARLRRHGLAVAVSGSSIFVMGGEVYMSNILRSVEVFDAASRCWAMGAEMRVERTNLAGAGYGARVVAAGGQNHDALALPSAEILECGGAGKWVALPPMSTPRQGHALVGIGEACGDADLSSWQGGGEGSRGAAFVGGGV